MSTIEVDKIIPQSGTDTQLGESGDTITIPAGATITNNGTASGFDTDTNDKVKVSANDTTPGFLNGKLVAGTNISLTEGSDGGDETLTAALTGTIATAQIADDAVTLAKMAPGTDGNIISYDASGNPVAVATGSAGQVLTSAGAGAPPTFAAASGGVNTPAFQAKLTTVTTTFSEGSLTTLVMNSEDFDTANAYSTSTGYFTPQTAGKYFCEVFVHADRGGSTMSDLKMAYVQIFKNGSSGSSYDSRVIQQMDMRNNYGRGFGVNVSGIFDLNGSSDYVYPALSIQTNSGSDPVFAGESNYTYFRAFKLIE